MFSRIARALDTIWRTADLEYGDPHEDEEGWFRDKHNMYNTYGNYDRSEELMTLVPGWREAKRQGWKPLGGGTGPFAYRGSGDSFEFIAPKHLNPDDDHWGRIPQRWMRYSLGEGGINDPYVRHAETFEDALDDASMRGHNILKRDYDPESGEFYQRLNESYPRHQGPSGRTSGPGSYLEDFFGKDGRQGHFSWVREQAAKRDARLAEGGKS